MNKHNPQRKLDAFFTVSLTSTKRPRPIEDTEEVKKPVAKPAPRQAVIAVGDNGVTVPSDPRPMDPINESAMAGLVGCSNAANAAQCQRIEVLIAPWLAREPTKNGYRRCLISHEATIDAFRQLGCSTHIAHGYDRILVEEFTDAKSGFGWRPEGKDYHPYCSVLTLGSTWPVVFAAKSLAEREVMYMMSNGCLLEVREPAYSKAERRVPAQQSMQGRFFGSVFEKGKRKELQCRREKNFRMVSLTFYHYMTDEDRQEEDRMKRARYAAYQRRQAAMEEEDGMVE